MSTQIPPAGSGLNGLQDASVGDTVVPAVETRAPRQETIVMPAPAAWLNANARTDRRKQTPDRRTWRDSAHLHGKSKRINPFTKAHILATLRFTTNAHRDPHNYYPTLKACIDGFVDAGLLPDDSSEYLIGPDVRMGQPLPKKPFGPVGEITFVFTDLSEEPSC
jgi:crossover junction endodeoxyribonuclease RusA